MYIVDLDWVRFYQEFTSASAGNGETALEGHNDIASHKACLKTQNLFVISAGWIPSLDN